MQRLSIVKEQGDRAAEGRAYGNLGNIYQSLGDFKQAINYHNKDLSIAKELVDRAGEGAANCNLGSAYHSLGRFKQAIEYHNQHLSIAKELCDRSGEGIAYGNLGNAYQSLADFKQAIEFHNQHLSIVKQLGHKAGEGIANCNLGNAYHNLADFKRAIEHHNQHLSIAKELGDRGGEGVSYGNLGNAYQSLGEFEQAIDYHNQHLHIVKEMDYKAGEGRAYGNLGNDYKILGDIKQAVKFFKQHLSIAKELGDRVGEGGAYGNLGNAFQSLGDYQQAIECLSQLVGIAKELGDKATEAAVYHSLGCAFESSGTLNEALDYYRSSVKLYNDVRALLQSNDVWKISFRNAFQYAYIDLWRTLVRLQKTDEALCAAEQGRAQALADLMVSKYNSEFQASEAFAPERTMSEILTDTGTQTVFVALESNTINLWLLKGTYVQFEKTTIENPTLLMEKAFKEIGVRVHVKCENRTLDDPEDEAPLNRESCQRIDDCENSSLRLLFDSIIRPIVNKLEGDEFIIVPDGPLCLVPYAACVDEASRYLSESTRIRVLPSLTSLKLITNCPDDYHNKTGALLVGDPCLEDVRRKRGKLPCLPWARQEVKMIGEILNTEPLTGKDATKDELLKRIGSVALVHIAAHGDMEAGEIALAPNPARTSKIPKLKDFMLTMSDVQAVQLRAKLVVLSCCHSAQGKITAEGVVGIARAFLGAGARSVLVSLWAIDDEATMEFMKGFYNYLGRGCSASVALNRAMKCLRESERFGAVKYWAPFVLIGDDVTIEFAKE